MLDDRIYPGG